MRKKKVIIFKGKLDLAFNNVKLKSNQNFWLDGSRDLAPWLLSF